MTAFEICYKVIWKSCEGVYHWIFSKGKKLQLYLEQTKIFQNKIFQNTKIKEFVEMLIFEHSARMKMFKVIMTTIHQRQKYIYLCS